MSSIDNPAEPSSQGGLFGNAGTNTSTDTTDQQARGGLFSDTTGIAVPSPGPT